MQHIVSAYGVWGAPGGGPSGPQHLPEALLPTLRALCSLGSPEVQTASAALAACFAFNNKKQIVGD